MKRYLFKITVFLFFIITATSLHAQQIRKIEFRNQRITDILMVLADMGGRSIIVDDTVTGTATFYFSDSEFEEALRQFLEACHLFYRKIDNNYFISRVLVDYVPDTSVLNVFAEDASIESIVRSLSRETQRTIIYDALPRETISLHSLNTSVPEILEILIRRHPDYSVEYSNNSYYIRRATAASGSSNTRLASNAITRRDDLYSMNIPRGSFSAIIAQLFRTADKEYSMLQRTDVNLENLYFVDRTFEQLLRLVLEQGSSDYFERDDIYYIFEIQRRDVLKKFKETTIVQLMHIPVTDVGALLPNELGASSFIKYNNRTNSVYLTGSVDEISPIIEFLILIDVTVEGRFYNRFELKHLNVKDFIALLPRELATVSPLIIPQTNAFIAQVSEDIKSQMEDYISLVDKRPKALPINLRYIKSEELLRFLPPSVSREEIVVSADPTLVFFTGAEERKKYFLADLKLIDQPKPQIRYQLLIIQYQKSSSLSRGSSVSYGHSDLDPQRTLSGAFSNLLNINFDIVSEFGYQLALQLNMQIGEDKARVLADTTLNGISGQDIRFENKNTFRYRDVALDPETGRPLYTGITREITSGLFLNINGWVSGDGMITMSVRADISKQADTGHVATTAMNPPPTSERVVNTQVRTRTGTPIIIGGLLQVEKIETVYKFPVLGSVPLVGRMFRNTTVSDETTEMVIYIVPFIQRRVDSFFNFERRKEEYYNRYILRKI
ncbi:MAG: hypothetical protein FWD87_10780 [Spirochaetaceae bacterium]|nr:hypothetical protein [Spirochaetaceae bacterium]